MQKRPGRRRFKEIVETSRQAIKMRIYNAIGLSIHPTWTLSVTLVKQLAGFHSRAQFWGSVGLNISQLLKFCDDLEAVAITVKLRRDVFVPLSTLSEHFIVVFYLRSPAYNN